MICHPQPRVIRSSSSAGGLSKHFRIQFFDSELGAWRMYASFRFLGEAEACVDALSCRGIEVRLIKSECCASAF